MPLKTFMNKAIFWDRDGTLIHDYGYNHLPDSHLTLLPGAVEALQAATKAGFINIVVTNQSGIGRGKFTEEQYHLFAHHLDQLFQAAGAEVRATYYCPHHPDEPCNCRKPNTGLPEQARADFDLDPTASIFVGDKDDDIRTGQALGCTTVRILPEENAYVHTVPADVTLPSLSTFASVVLSLK
jgi:D,D-heptose 1,7-bisphosphate phosphatase